MVGEELRAIDADHFWIGEVMVDLVQLGYEELQASRDTARFTNQHCHQIGVSMDNLRLVAKDLAGLTKTPENYNRISQLEWTKKQLKQLNSLGLHTGYTEKS